MSGTLLPVAQQWLDNNASPLAGGFVYTYAAGTTTPQDTYQDFDLTILNTNPVILDSSGRGEIWLSTGLYSISVTDSQGNVIYTQDNVGQASSGGSTSAGPFGAATDIASASLTDLGTISGNFANITGSTTIISFGSSATTSNPIYLIKFAGAPSITASSDILITANVTTIGNNISAALNDHALVEYLGSGQWKIFAYWPGDGSINGTDITGNTVKGLT